MEDQKASGKLQIVSSNPASSLDLAPADLCLKRAKLLFGCFRKGEANDPEIFVASVAAVLGDYPASVVERVTDPRTGLARRCNFIPTIKEISDACDLEMEPLRRRLTSQKRQAARDQDARAQLDPEAEARVRDGFEQLARVLKSMNDPT